MYEFVKVPALMVSEPPLRNIRHSGKNYVYQRTQGVVEMESRSADPTPQSSHTRSTDDDGATVST